MVASASMSCFPKVGVFLALLFALANCRSFENIANDRGLKTIANCDIVHNGTDWAGNDINQRPFENVPSAPACCRRCNSAFGARVVAYIYRTVHQHCYCKYAVGPASDCPTCQGRANSPPDDPPTCTTQTRVDSFGNDLPGSPIEGVSNPQDCCTRCHNYGTRNFTLDPVWMPKLRLCTGCVAWVWRSDDRRCYLKYRRVRLRSCPPCTFGEPNRP